MRCPGRSTTWLAIPCGGCWISWVSLRNPPTSAGKACGHTCGQCVRNRTTSPWCTPDRAQFDVGSAPRERRSAVQDTMFQTQKDAVPKDGWQVADGDTRLWNRYMIRPGLGCPCNAFLHRLA
ncbi:hypothetical protein CO2235_U1010101 [Cupriavidus oxalaticus]|uniref:Uncharacterized protein n=1 Tax=Cupriavidus oxalaticus TaxID=96344 RepID=A0A375FG58_9BURK|nr:hypothetical protein CO2235_U1010101 [Cupriavidus oxalaticus]